MKKGKTKLTAVLLSVGCLFACIGAGVCTVDARPKSGFVMAQAEATIHRLGKLAVHAHSSGTTSNAPKATQLYMKIASGAAIPYPDSTWETEFAYESGAGWKLNGKSVSVTDIESTNSGLFVALTGVQTGDVLSVEGTFYSADVNAKYIIDESKFRWSGTVWENYVEYTTQQAGAVEFSSWTSGNNFLYLKRVDGQAFATPQDGNNGWTATFLDKDGAGVNVNGRKLSAGKVKFPGGNMFIELGSILDGTAQAPVKGDVLTVGGTFYSAEYGLQYVIEESKFVWDGTIWNANAAVGKYTEYQLGEMSVCWPSSSVGEANASQLYLKPTEVALPFLDPNWDTEFAYESGAGVALNGKQITIADLESSNAGLFLQLKGIGVQVGDVISIGGTYVCEKESAKYIIRESRFQWNGATWINHIEESELEAYDVISISDVGLGNSKTIRGTVEQYVNLAFAPTADNTTNSVAFRFAYHSADTNAGNLCFRLRGSQWQGVKFWITEGKIVLVDANKSYPLASNTDYVMELGAISMKSGKVWTYVKLDGALVLSQVISTSQFSEFKDYPTTGFTSHFSMYASDVAETVLGDELNATITYVSTAGTYQETRKKESVLVLPTGKTTKTFIGWANDGKLYRAREEFGSITQDVTFTAVEMDFAMMDGAAIRLANANEDAGIRFTSTLKEQEWKALLSDYDVAQIRYGTLIMPYDFLAYGQKPNLEEFTVNEEILRIEGTKAGVENGYLVIRGAMNDLYEGNYGRLFAGRGYMEIVLKNGESWTVYTPFNSEDNVRSIRQIAIAFQADTSASSGADDVRYATITQQQRAVVDGYIASNGITLMDYESYAANMAPVIAWNYPKLDDTNQYQNAANVAIAEQMKAAGIKIVGLTGHNMVFVNNVLNIEKTRQIIAFFWGQGLYTFAFAANTGGVKDGGAYANMNIDLSQNGYPDFSDCEGFIGFLAWDEPSNQQEVMDKLADFAKAFEKKYAGTDVIFMVNLLPSYATYFNPNKTGWGQSNMDVIDKAAFQDYLQMYCDTVLSQVSGVKWLSLDSYPINANGSLTTNFLFDLAMLKYVAELNDAHSHVVLQSSGWQEGSATGKSRIPTEAEMRMQVYAAMAFGIDSFSWFTYSPSHMSSTNAYFTPVDENGVIDEEAYAALQKVNAEVDAIGKIYNAFTWKGVLLGTGTDDGIPLVNRLDADYEAYAAVSGTIGTYELKASDTKYLASVATNKKSLNYLMSVMEDAHGNEGYVLCNYNSHEENRAQTITITFAENITEVVIYRGGVAETIPVANKTLQVSLATGEGVIILPSKIG